MWAIVAGVLSGLLSGVIGNIVAHRLAVGRARRERTETAGSYLAALEAEMEDNVRLSARPILGDAKVVLLAKQWENASPFVESLPLPVLDPIRRAYVAVQQYNCTVEYERAKVPRGHGDMDASLVAQAGAANSALREALSALWHYKRRSLSSGE
jgi:hypothetical protein